MMIPVWRPKPVGLYTFLGGGVSKNVYTCKNVDNYA